MVSEAALVALATGGVAGVAAIETLLDRLGTLTHYAIPRKNFLQWSGQKIPWCQMCFVELRPDSESS